MLPQEEREHPVSQPAPLGDSPQAPSQTPKVPPGEKRGNWKKRCKYYSTAKGCRNGDQCPFYHPLLRESNPKPMRADEDGHKTPASPPQQTRVTPTPEGDDLRADASSPANPVATAAKASRVKRRKEKQPRKERVAEKEEEEEEEEALEPAVILLGDSQSPPKTGKSERHKNTVTSYSRNGRTRDENIPPRRREGGGDGGGGGGGQYQNVTRGRRGDFPRRRGGGRYAGRHQRFQRVSGGAGGGSEDNHEGNDIANNKSGDVEIGGVSEMKVASRPVVIPRRQFNFKVDELPALVRLYSFAAAPAPSSGYAFCLNPSDPTLEELFPQGIHIHMEVGAVYEEAPYTLGDRDDLSKVIKLEITDEGFSEGFSRSIEKSFCDHLRAALRGRHPRPIYESLRRLDRDIPELHESERKRAAKKVWPTTPWTDSEQQRLESGLIYYGKVADPVYKWRQISTYVGTRSARQCAERFQVCRALALEEAARSQETVPPKAEGASAASDTESSDSSALSSSGSSGSDDSDLEEDHKGPEDDEDGGGGKIQGAAGSSLRQHGQTLTFRGLETENVGVVSLVKFRLIVSCGRCGKKLDASLNMPRPGIKSPSAFVECTSCHNGIRVLATGAFVHGSGYDSLATVIVDGGNVSDVLPSDYLTSCISCNSNIRYAELYSGLKRTSVCRHCHSRTSICFAQVQIAGSQAPMVAGKVVPIARKKKEKDPFVLTVGQPLPKNGACSHYKKSFRWFRFPCCGKAFACEKCHDAASTHKAADMATRIICGLCSREQSANNSTCSCGSQMTASRSKHWEGGKGCRDPTTMSRKDDKKYKLLHKQQQALQKAKSAK